MKKGTGSENGIGTGRNGVRESFSGNDEQSRLSLRESTCFRGAKDDIYSQSAHREDAFSENDSRPGLFNFCLSSPMSLIPFLFCVEAPSRNVEPFWSAVA
jgi:hypothetical protein